MTWQNPSIRKPAKGSLVIIKTRRQTCTCGGYDQREVYFDGYFHGIKNQQWIEKWQYSPANDILSLLEKQEIKLEPCKNCVE